MQKSIYIYPLSSCDDRLGLYNPYIDDLIRALGRHYTFVNKNKPSKSGIFNLLKYLGKTDYVFFNWIEKLPTNKFGIFQTYALFLLLHLCKKKGIKIVWTMHNKLLHSVQHKKLSAKIFDKMLAKSDLIVTHATEGIRFGCERIHGIHNKFIYFPHPVKDRRIANQPQKKRDLLIWGTISPYKGIEPFLKALYDADKQMSFSLLIVGKCTSDDYFKKLKRYENEKIEIQNTFIADEELQLLIAESRLVLFTYSQASILSSGVLMDSLGFGAKILGPEVGAFADLAKEKVIETFSHHTELITKIESSLMKDNLSHQKKLDSFLKRHTWDQFAEYLRPYLENSNLKKK